MKSEGSLPCSQKPTIVRVPSQMDPIHNLQPYFRNIHFNIILSSMPRSPEWPLLTGFQTKIVYAFSFIACALHVLPIFSSRLVHPKNIWWCESDAAPRYAFFSKVFSRHPSWVQTFSKVPYAHSEIIIWRSQLSLGKFNVRRYSQGFEFDNIQ
jgi:hypothetical protein